MADYDFHKPQKLQFNFLATTNCIQLILGFYLKSMECVSALSLSKVFSLSKINTGGQCILHKKKLDVFSEIQQ